MPQVCLLISSNSRTSSWYWLSRVTCTCISLISSSHLNLKGVINNIPHSFPFLGMPKLAPASHDKWAAQVIWLVICYTVQTRSWHNCSFTHCFKIRSKPRRRFEYGWYYLVSGSVHWNKPTSLPKIFLWLFTWRQWCRTSRRVLWGGPFALVSCHGRWGVRPQPLAASARRRRSSACRGTLWSCTWRGLRSSQQHSPLQHKGEEVWDAIVGDE